LTRSRPALSIACGVLLAALALGAAPAHAQFVNEIKVGVLRHDVPDLWSGFQLEPTSVDINGEILFQPSMPFLFGQIRPALGVTANTRGATSHAYVDMRWQIEAPSGLFFALGLGAAVHDGTTDDSRADRKALGSRLLFHIPAEIGWRFDGHNSVSVYFEHTSNAYTQTFNEGMDRIGVRYGYRF